MATSITPADVLDALAEKDGPVLTQEAFPNATFEHVKSALDQLKSREMIAYKTLEKLQWTLEKEAEDVVANGSQEARVFEAVRRAVGGMKIGDLAVCASHFTSTSQRISRGQSDVRVGSCR